MKTHPHIKSCTPSPTPSTPAASCPPPYSAPQRQRKGPVQLHRSPQTQQSRHHRAPYSQRTPQPDTKTGQTHLAPTMPPQKEASEEGYHSTPKTVYSSYD
ncbi:hypothetical protein GOODEAATRI_020183 [Goodea atripinnis]|uniref:Uncharacterized protein n=1 Tax=Goodea atripinnis TaxID=208336 RepID=A0ABV0NLS1_9TELE